jgi:hypothetical protein
MLAALPALSGLILTTLMLLAGLVLATLLLLARFLLAALLRIILLLLRVARRVLLLVRHWTCSVVLEAPRPNLRITPHRRWGSSFRCRDFRQRIGK